MPPRKKARVSQATSPDPEPTATTPTPAAASPGEAALNDPWTDDEEIGLFKGLMRWKPTGIHKHFRLISLHAWLLENHYIHPRNEHTKPAGIWQKLNQLYDVPALDAREDARQLSPLRTTVEQEAEDEERQQTVEDDVYSVAANRIETETFELPPDVGFEEAMWKRRLPDKREDESDMELPEINMAEDPPVRFVPSFSIEPSEAATPKTAKSKKNKGGRASTAAAPRRSARKTESVADKTEEEDEGDGEENEEDDEDEGDESDEDEQSQASTPGPRGRRASKSTNTRSKATGKSKARTRGRAK